ncbi:FixH family protein [Lutimonas saemankumensis]|uniref:FixH family protein n=1 Tax=Lutimonas saemankumensis TaxID=483016 RepID=UPI001CD54E43|nr:FixH family protein [Lutimonas saemankumensis]MCA0932068.1 FixH family protein [Lutimonas saemankumensis]
MKIRLNWGTGIFLAMLAFMIFILTFVYKSIALDEYQHELVSEDYYKDELHYQEEIDKINNAKELSENIELENTNEGILIKFPEEVLMANISGTIYFQRLSNEKLDFVEEIKLDNHKQLIRSDRLVSGKWIVKIDWKNQEKEYLFKDSWFY